MGLGNDTAMGEVCRECGYTDGHNVAVCPLVLAGKEKMMPGLSPGAVERLRVEWITSRPTFSKHGT